MSAGNVVQRNLLPIVGAVVFTLTAASSGMIHVSDQRAVDRQAEQIETASKTLESAKSTIDGGKDEAVSSTTGVSPQRKKSDDTAIARVMGEALTWKSADEYTTARKTLLDGYKISPEDQFMVTFMPALGGSNQTPSKAGASSSFVSVESTVTGIGAGRYTYLADVVYATTGANGSSVEQHLMVTYATDVDGRITSLTAEPSSAPQLSN